MVKKIIIGLVLAVAIVLVVISFSLDGIVKSAIEKNGSKILGTSVTVQNVELSLFSGKGTIKGLVVANPHGFTEPYLFKLGEVHISIAVSSLLSGPIKINDISITSPNIMLETNATTSNLQTVLSNIEKASSSKPSHSQVSAPSEKNTTPIKASAPEKKIIISHFAITQPVVNTNLGNLATVNMKVPNVVLTHLGGTQGISANQIAKEIISALSQALGKAKTQFTPTQKGKQLEALVKGVGALLNHK